MKHISKRKRNGRFVRLVSIDAERIPRDGITPNTACKPIPTSVPPLPRSQYTTTLRRRSIRKLEDNGFNKSEEHGDISLGMKLIVAGGRVIVQSLNALKDGLASPAQLSGVIHRGDVLLAIGNLSLANLPVDQLMEGLRPLSTPDSEGLYKICLDLRFESGAGLALLAIHEGEHARMQGNTSAEAMLKKIPMVDQLNGAPLFGPKHSADTSRDENLSCGVNVAEEKNLIEDKLASEKQIIEEGIENFSLDFDSLISATLAKERSSDRERYKSEYFDWREDFSELLRTAVCILERDENDHGKRLTKIERLELGHKIMRITNVLELNMEEIDKGRDPKSQKNVSSGISSWSGSSTIGKRQYNMDGTITEVRSTYDNPLDGAIDEESIGSEDSSVECVDSDKLLLGLAARDEIWRKLVITMLAEASQDIKNIGEEKSQDSPSQKSVVDLPQKLGYFLFRDKNTSQSIKLETKNIAFPPKDITRVLFDLATCIAASANDDVTLFGASSKLSSNFSGFRSGTTRTGGRRRASARGDILLAKRFVLDEALPRWLESFRPLNLDQRMALWPRQRNRTDSMSGTYTGTVNRSEYTGRSSDADSLTLGSDGSHTQISGAQKKKKDIRELVDNQLFDPESQTESQTCFLITYFCSENIIDSDKDEERNLTQKKSFIENFGAYIQIQTCLSYASLMEDRASISAILKVAKNDPNHRDALKEIQKSNDLLFYDSAKLSAVLQCLEQIRFEKKEKRRNVLRDLCVSGYPDIQPWQVRSACLSQVDSNETNDHCSDSIMEYLYYTYLCHLLNPVDGHEGARQDLDLLKEFCEWSVGVKPKEETNPTRMENFLSIAASSSSHHKKYRRDLIMLMDLSLAINNHELALTLVDEITVNAKLLSNKDALHSVLCCLQKIGAASLTLCSDPSKQRAGFETLKKVLKLFEKMSSSDSLVCRNSINVPDELLTLFQKWKIESRSNGDDRKMYLLIDFVIDVSSVPADVIKALLLWSPNHDGKFIFSRVENLLRRGVHFAVFNCELSGTLLRLNYARTTFEGLDSIDKDTGRRGDTTNMNRIWDRMGTGDVSINK